jgi:hypothetical protein
MYVAMDVDGYSLAMYMVTFSVGLKVSVGKELGSKLGAKLDGKWLGGAPEGLALLPSI